MLRGELQRGQPAEQTGSARQVARSESIAVFDLDGTLTRADTFLPFLATYAWRQRKAWRVAIIPFVVIAYFSRLVSDRTAKQFLLRLFLRGESRADIRGHAEEFCHRWIEKQLHPQGLRRLRDHQECGDRVIVVSASPDAYVPVVAKFLGVEEAVCTRVLWEGDRCLGTIDGRNCKREAKIEMLTEYLGSAADPERMVAYGDSPADLPLLRWAGKGYLIGKRDYRAVEAEKGE